MKRSRSFGLRFGYMVGLLGGVWHWAPPVYAQEEPDAASIAAARALAIDGVKLADTGNCEAAVVKLGKAEELYHSQVVASRLGECEIKLGRIVEGTERLRRLLREPVPEHASPAVLNAFVKAKEVLEVSATKVAQVKLDISGPEPRQTTVKINGTVVPAAGLGVEFPANPGPADLEVSAVGYFTETERVVLRAGEKLEISVALKLEPSKPATAAVTPPPKPPRTHVERAQTQAPPVTVQDRAEPNYAPAYVSFVIGAAGLGVGAWYGLAAMRDYDDLAPKCPNDRCPVGESERLEAAQTKGTIATVGVGVGAAAVVLGTIILLTTGNDEDTRTSTAGVSPWIGTNEVGVWGTF